MPGTNPLRLLIKINTKYPINNGKIFENVCFPTIGSKIDPTPSNKFSMHACPACGTKEIPLRVINLTAKTIPKDTSILVSSEFVKYCNKPSLEKTASADDETPPLAKTDELIPNKKNITAKILYIKIRVVFYAICNFLSKKNIKNFKKYFYCWFLLWILIIEKFVVAELN
jgi:hypothetical protein